MLRTDVLCRMWNATHRLTYVWLTHQGHAHVSRWSIHIRIWVQTHTQVSCLFPCSPHPASPQCVHIHRHTCPHYTQDRSLGSRRYAEECGCFPSLNATLPEPPVNHPDYFIMNLNLSSGAVSADRSLGLANALGYFWQHENPQNMWSVHITILSSNFNSLLDSFYTWPGWKKDSWICT